MQTIRKRIKFALILSPAIFMCAFWVLALSSSPLLESMGLVKLLLAAAVLSLSIAYFITLFIAAIQMEIDTKK